MRVCNRGDSSAAAILDTQNSGFGKSRVSHMMFLCSNIDYVIVLEEKMANATR
jgi:hypothetical protein